MTDFKDSPKGWCGACCCCFWTIFIIVLLADSGHKIEEGYIGIYYKNGALQDGFTEPGIHFKSPFVSTVKMINVRKSTEELDSCPCVTQDGIQNSFDGIQVLNQVMRTTVVDVVRNFGSEFKKDLIYDRVAEQIVLFCANHTIDEVYNEMFLDVTPYVWAGLEAGIEKLATGAIEVMNIVVPKPNIPADIASNYKEVKVKWTEQLVATQEQATQEILKATEEMIAIADANRERNVTLIEKDTELQQKVADAQRQAEILALEVEMSITESLGLKNVTEINAEIAEIERTAEADLVLYEMQELAKANLLLFTDEYVQLELAKSMATNTKFFFSGDDSVVGSMLGGFFGGAFDPLTQSPTQSPTD